MGFIFWPVKFAIGLIVLVVLIIACVRVYHAYEREYGPIHIHAASSVCYQLTEAGR